MSTFIPNKGQHFYVAMRPRTRIISGGFGGEDQVVETADGSYRQMVFVCTGKDDSYVIADAVVGGYSSTTTPYMHRIDDVYFSPVGPDVMKVLKLEYKETE